ncbi:MAG: hypothetical protein Q9184_000972 [Pyrenodesmia sp. 2 TL-2023]
MGKVHGSLARAGKVKSQTPKVRLPLRIGPSSPPARLDLSKISHLADMERGLEADGIGFVRA